MIKLSLALLAAGVLGAFTACTPESAPTDKSTAAKAVSENAADLVQVALELPGMT